MADASARKVRTVFGQADAQKKSSTFSVKRQTGFGAIALFCFFLLYVPIATLVVDAARPLQASGCSSIGDID